ncbi:MAG: HAD family hydrolase [Patescibacteria group bacterium]|nr:HAD family hydrolase [Patescibacteria group bacterium]
MIKNRAVFLDRDGVINRNRDDYVKNIQEMEILSNVSDAIRLLNEENYLVVIISNQSAINRGLLSIETLDEIHQFLKREVGKKGAKIDAIYFCPHKPDENCDCRKPQPTMIFRASEDLGINLSESYMIGDRDSDKFCAQRANVKFIPMKTDDNLLHIVRDFLGKHDK